jgi:hypothetical protein
MKMLTPAMAAELGPSSVGVKGLRSAIFGLARRRERRLSESAVFLLTFTEKRKLRWNTGTGTDCSDLG